MVIALGPFIEAMIAGIASHERDRLVILHADISASSEFMNKLRCAWINPRDWRKCEAQPPIIVDLEDYPAGADRNPLHQELLLDGAILIRISKATWPLHCSRGLSSEFASHLPSNILFGSMAPERPGFGRAVALHDGVPDIPSQTSPPFRPLAIVSAFNEEDVIEEVILDLLDQGCDVHVLENWSTDATWDILHRIQPPAGNLVVERFPILRVEESSWRDILRRKEEIALGNPGRWILHSDADEIRRSPFAGATLAKSFTFAEACGASRIDFTVLDFRPVHGGGYVPGTLSQSFRHFQFGGHLSYYVQCKAWLQGDSRVDLVTSGGHVAEFEGARDFRYKFLVKHYPIRSMAHGRSKIYIDRARRWAQDERQELGWHVHYDNTPTGTSFIWPAEALHLYEAGMFPQEYGAMAHTEMARAVFDGGVFPVHPPLRFLSQELLGELEAREKRLRTLEAGLSTLCDAFHQGLSALPEPLHQTQWPTPLVPNSSIGFRSMAAIRQIYEEVLHLEKVIGDEQNPGSCVTSSASIFRELGAIKERLEQLENETRSRKPGSVSLLLQAFGRLPISKRKNRFDNQRKSKV